MSQLIKIGKLTRLHGIKGGLVLHMDSDVHASLHSGQALFLSINNIPTPFFIQDIKPLHKNYTVLFDSVKHTDDAASLIGHEIWVDEHSVVREKIQDVSGYLLKDEIKGEIGRVSELRFIRGQGMLTLFINEQEILLPFVDEFIRKIDEKNKTIYYCAPEGLLDLYF